MSTDITGITRAWPVLIAAVAVVGTFSVSTYRVDALAKDHEEYEENFAEDDVRERSDAIEMETFRVEQRHLKEDVDEIKDDVKENGDKLDAILEELRESN